VEERRKPARALRNVEERRFSAALRAKHSRALAPVVLWVAQRF